MMAAPALRCGNAALIIQNGAQMLVFIVASKSSLEMSRMEAFDCCRAALQARMSIPPNFCAACSTSFWQKASSRRSPGMATPLRPALLMSLITSCASGSSAGR
jgi:hypothetical protein